MRDAVAWTALVAAGSLFACSSSSAPGAGSSDAGEDRHVKHDSGVEFGLDATDDVPPMPYEAAPPPSLGGVRVANWSASAPPVDFCLAPHGTTKWKGPMLAATGPEDGAAYGDGSASGLTFSNTGTAGLGFPGVTAYFYLSPGQYDARFVAAGSPECDVALVAPDTTTLPAVTKGGLVTVALLADVGGDEDAGVDAGRDAGGDAGRNGGGGLVDAGHDAGSSGLKVVGFTDDVTLPPASLIGGGHLGLRFINAAPSVPLAAFGITPPAFAIGGTQTGPQATPVFVQMFSAVAYAHASSPSDTAEVPPFVDNQGYVFLPASRFPIGQTDPTSGDVLDTTFNAVAIRSQGDVPLAGGPSTVTAGVLLTEVLLATGPGSPASDAGNDGGELGLQLLQCVDNGGAVGLAAPCHVISQ